MVIMNAPRTRRYYAHQPMLGITSFLALLPEEEQGPLKFVMDAVESFDLSVFYEPYRGNDKGGNSPYDPALMISLLLYAYIRGVQSSRKIEKLIITDLGFRHLSGGHRPNFRTIAGFRKRHLKDFHQLFTQVLLVAKSEGLLTVGEIAIDGTKIRAHASKLKNRNVLEHKAEVTGIVDKILSDAEKTDACETKDQGNKNSYLPKKSNHVNNFKGCRPKFNKSSILFNISASEISEDDEEIPPDKAEAPPDPAKSQAKAVKAKKRNLTDPDSRLMKTPQDGFQQAFNAQIATDKHTQLILGAQVTDAHNDQGQLHPMIDEVIENLGESPTTVCADGGYSNESDLERLEKREIEGVIATRKNVNIAKNPATGRMLKKLSTPEGRARYRCRAWAAEAPIAWLKCCRNFRKFSVRGLDSVSGEFALVCAAQNLIRMFKLLNN